MIQTQGAEVVGSIRAELYGDGATIPQVKAGTARPTALEYASTIDFGETGANFTRRVVGYFIPPANGNYVFFITSDDHSELWLSTDATAANKRLIAQETGWSNANEWTASAGGSDINQKRSDRWSPAGSTNDPYASGIPLTANLRYFLEIYHQEGGGGDNLAVYYKRVGEPDPAIANATTGAPADPSNMTGPVIAMDQASTLTFLAQPQNRRAAPGQSITFSALADSPTATYEWLRNGAVIPGETAATLTTIADTTATFAVRATEGASVVTSSNAVLTVGQLVQIPNSVKWEFWNDDALTRADIEDPGFATAPDIATTLPTFEVPTNFSDEYVARVSGLFVAPTNGNYVFFIAADDTGDLFLSTDATPANKRLIAQEVGWSGVRNWNGIGGTGANLSDQQAIEQKRSDSFKPDPINDPTTMPFASGISLVAGQSYYIEAVMEEGGGGDNLAVTYKLVGEPNPASGSITKIDSSVLGNFAGATTLNGATITFPTQLTNMTGLQNRTVTMNIVADSGYEGDATGAGPVLNYQWQTAPAGSSTFTNIPGALGTGYTTPLLSLADQGRQYRVLARAGDASVPSAVSTLTVTPDTVAPRQTTVGSVNAARNVVVLNFNEALSPATATNAANYVFAPGNITASSATLSANGTVVTITTSAPLTPNVTNTLTITGTQDLAGNPVAANSTIQFIFNPVTYSANILFDQPVAYFRFEETSGTVATNSGTSGIQGAYYDGDEAAIGEGGTPREAVNVPGPRPGDFAGFEANNLAGDFDGLDDWVDARSQYLQAVPAFTLEYWVRPNRTNEFEEVWPARVALVGQNDAVEYGFITPGTIQIWTAGGGSLDTPYNTPTATGAGTVPFPDDTWHHVATIGDGTSIRTYFDGVLVGTGGSATASYGTSPYNVHIGGGGGFDATGNWFRGQMDEVAIFNKAIPADRVRAHFLAGKEGGVITVSGAVTPAEPTGGDTTASISKSGQTITINSTPAGGTVEATDSLATPNWQAIGTAPQNVPANGNTRFFRIRR